MIKDKKADMNLFEMMFTLINANIWYRIFFFLLISGTLLSISYLLSGPHQPLLS